MTPDSSLRRLALAATLLLAAVPPALAQVGHDPSRSPYRTLRYGQFVGITGGAFRGSGGQIGVAPHHGETIGLRYDFLGAGTLTLGLQGSYLKLERFIVDRDLPIETARRGPVSASTMMVEGIFQFNLTGGKSWHRIAPFVSAGVGLALAEENTTDSSGFKFRAKALLTPGIGARIFLSDRLFLRLEARSTFWQVSYPLVYREAPRTDPTKPPVVSGNGKEWTTSGWYTLGLSYAFHRPF